MATPFMELTLPVVSSTVGPEWASLLNAALTLVDAHDHTEDKGARITPAAININANLEFNDKDAYELRSARFNNQDAPLATINDVRSLYVSGSNLYYNNGTGTAVQITSGAGLNAASLGGIGGDYATSSASVSYSNSNKTFSFTQTANTSAHLDVGNVVIRQATASAHGITVKSPNSLSAAYNFILPTGLPGSGLTKILTLDSAGQVGAVYDADAATLEVSSNTLRIKDLGVTTGKINDLAVATGKIAANAVTRGKLEAVGQQVSSEFNNSVSGAAGDLTGLSVTITTSGRPVFVGLITSSATDSLGGIGPFDTTLNTSSVTWAIKRGGVAIAAFNAALFATQPSGALIELMLLVPCSSIWHLDVVAAGTYTYTFAQTGGNSYVNGVKLVAFEL